MTSDGSAREALLVLDAALNVRAANRAFYEMFHLAPEECVGHKVYELGGRAWDAKLRPMLETVLSGAPQSDHFELVHDDKQGGNGALWLSARLVPSADPGDSTVLLAIEDSRPPNSRGKPRAKEPGAQHFRRHGGRTRTSSTTCSQ